MSFPRNTVIHSYYKHDFNEERKYYESEVISRVLDNHEVTKWLHCGKFIFLFIILVYFLQ